MAFLNCGRCGLVIKVHAAFSRVDNCPRCLARSATAMPMVLSTSGVTQAVGWGLDAPRENREGSATVERDA